MRRLLIPALLAAAPLPAATAPQMLAAGTAAYSAGRFGEAAVDFHRLADQGSAVAETMLGTLYANGQGVRRDPAAAAGYICRAAHRGYAPAQLAFARMLADGTGVARDPAEAWRWLRRAARQGDARIVGAAQVEAMHLSSAGPPPPDTVSDWRPWPGGD